MALLVAGRTWETVSAEQNQRAESERKSDAMAERWKIDGMEKRKKTVESRWVFHSSVQWLHGNQIVRYSGSYRLWYDYKYGGCGFMRLIN